jgi:hypothetical protein
MKPACSKDSPPAPSFSLWYGLHGFLRNRSFPAYDAHWIFWIFDIWRSIELQLTSEFGDGQTIGQLSGEFNDGQTIGQLAGEFVNGQTIIGQQWSTHWQIRTTDRQSVNSLASSATDRQLVNSLASSATDRQLVHSLASSATDRQNTSNNRTD